MSAITAAAVAEVIATVEKIAWPVVVAAVKSGDYVAALNTAYPAVATAGHVFGVHVPTAIEVATLENEVQQVVSVLMPVLKPLLAAMQQELTKHPEGIISDEWKKNPRHQYDPKTGQFLK